MPFYCYSTSDGETVERFYSIEDHPGTIELDDGRVARRNITAEHRGFAHVKESIWPMRSKALACRPQDVGKAMAFAESKGVPTEYDRRTGEPILRNRKHRRDFFRIRRVFDKNAGYGDAAPRTL